VAVVCPNNDPNLIGASGFVYNLYLFLPESSVQTEEWEPMPEASSTPYKSPTSVSLGCKDN